MISIHPHSTVYFNQADLPSTSIFDLHVPDQTKLLNYPCGLRPGYIQYIFDLWSLEDIFVARRQTHESSKRLWGEFLVSLYDSYRLAELSLMLVQPCNRKVNGGVAPCLDDMFGGPCGQALKRERHRHNIILL